MEISRESLNETTMNDDSKELGTSSENTTCSVGHDESCILAAEPISVSGEDMNQDDSVFPSSAVIVESDADHGFMVTNLVEPLETLENSSIMKLQQQHGAYFPFAVLITFCCWGGWYYRRFKKQQKEWCDLSKLELRKIQERSLFSAVRNDLSEDVPPTNKQSEDVDSRPVIKSEGNDTTSKAIVCSQIKYIESHSTMLDDHSVGASSCYADQVVLSTKTCTNRENPQTAIRKAAYSDTLSGVRARQQMFHEMNIKSVKQQRRDQQKLRQKQLLNSLQHGAADEAHRRRTETITQEQISLSKLSSGTLHQRQQTMLEELQEMERRTLLQQQNSEYLESLQVDQERAKTKALKLEKIKMQQKLIHNSKSRLVRSGVQLSGLLDDFEHKLLSGGNEGVVGNKAQVNCHYCDQKVRVRLLLPSGQRFQGTFAGSHCIGLLYDFALVLLENEHLLRIQEDVNEDNEIVTKTESGEDSDEYPSLDCNDYTHIKSGWEEVFHSFSIVSTYPQKTHKDLSATLSESGLTESATLLVVVESE